ncbi:hypothetical protein ACFQ21_30385 [Ohtaekwangia kribbensis]|uniref:YD repeat-containing protein n=1 Tax=Ohtaekwangia kribbensis TaxID=688913 RepID=A0ABW3KBS2_9BACT
MKNSILLLCLLLSVVRCLAQENQSVDPLTGKLSISIPLFTVSDGDVSVPGVLLYTANGVRVNDDGGWVGQNWDISAQSYGVTRQMRSLPDDYSGTSPDNRRGWLRSTISLPSSIRNFTPSTDNNIATCSDELANYNFLNTIDYDQDTEPDVFYVNAPGLSFQFYFDENKVPQVVPYQDVIVTPNTVSGTITSFTVTDNKGVQYKFDELETITQSVKAVNTYYLVRRSKMHFTPVTYHTGWKLTKMISPIYGTIDFTYRTVNSVDNNLTPDKNKLKYLYPVTFTNATGANGKLEYNRSYTFKIPLKISSPITEVQFVSSINDGTAVGLLKSIQVFDKRGGTLQSSKTITLEYSNNNTRSFLQVLLEHIGNSAPPNIYYLEYYGGDLANDPPYPTYNSTYKDDWNFHALSSGPNFMLYQETAVRGSLKRITYPHKAYSVFFYEPHDYINGTVKVEGAGIRIRKVVSFNGISKAADMIKEYEYKTSTGETSGKLQHRPMYAISGTRVDKYLGTIGARYRDVQLANPGASASLLSAYFTVKASEEISHSDLLAGSSVAYERVVEKIKDGGYTVYEYELSAFYGEATANNNEWEASRVLIARQPSGNSFCFETGPLTEGINQYPSPPNPNYSFARGMLRRVSDFRDDGVVRRQVDYDYQRVYGTTAIRKIYGLALEELPTYYHNGSSYVDGKMFVYSKYAINTDVMTVLKKSKETFFASSDLTKKIETSTEYFYSTGNHREIEKIVSTSSDQSQTITRLKYVKDYFASPTTDQQATSLTNLVTAHRTALPVETILSKMDGSVEKYISGNLNYYQTISGKVYPHRQYSFQSVDGITSFVPSFFDGNKFNFDQTNYVLVNTFLSFDNFGNVKEAVGRDKVIVSNRYGYSGSLPVIKVNNAHTNAYIFTDFESSLMDGIFSPGWSATYIEGRFGSKAVLLPVWASNTPNFLVGGATNYNVQSYIFSCWLKPSTSGTLSITLNGIVAASLPFAPSTTWKYHAVSVPVSAGIGDNAFSVMIKTNTEVNIDDVVFYPSHSSFQTTTYAFPYGPSISTDSQGNTSYISYDGVGRVKAVYDRDGNILKTYEYKHKLY